LSIQIQRMAICHWSFVIGRWSLEFLVEAVFNK